MNRFETRNAFLFRLAALLLLGVLLTMRLFAGLPARFSSSATGSSGDVGIALQAIAVTGIDGTPDFVFQAGTSVAASAPYKFKVTNKTAQGICEVDMKYKVMISLPGPIMFSACKIYFDGKLLSEAPEKSADGKDYIFPCTTTFKAGIESTGPEHKVTVAFDSSQLPNDSFNYIDVNSHFANPDSNKLAEIGNAIFYSNNIEIFVISEQID